MNEHFCTYAGARDDMLAAYLYDEARADERATFERHLAVCAVCRAELDALGAVRADLRFWTPPAPSKVVALGAQTAAAAPRTLRTTLQDVPAWMMTAAATLVVGAALGLANLEISYTATGLSMRTGWKHVEQSGGEMRTAVAPVEASASPAPWRADIVRLEQELRSMRDREQKLASSSPKPGGDDAVLRRGVRALIRESEQRQQRELALRVAAMSRDVQAQRQADLVRINRNLGIIQNRTGMEVMRTQQQVNSLAQRVSQRQ